MPTDRFKDAARLPGMGALLMLAKRVAGYCSNATHGDAIENLTLQEIAVQLHVYRESVTTTLGELRKSVIAVDRKRHSPAESGALECTARELGMDPLSESSAEGATLVGEMEATRLVLNRDREAVLLKQALLNRETSIGWKSTTRPLTLLNRLRILGPPFAC